jgi:hypothetical protein
MGDGLDGTVENMILRRTNIVAAGDFLISGGTLLDRQIASFSSGRWVAENSALAEGLVHAVTFTNDVLFMGGEFSMVWWNTWGRSIGRKLGSLWRPLGYGLTLDAALQPGEVFALTGYAGGIAAGGSFSRAGGFVANNVAFYDGTTWVSLGAGVDGAVLTLTEYRGHLVVGGSFSTAGGLPFANIAAWDGVQWVEDVPVTLDDLRLNASADGVDMSWRLPAVSLQTLSSVSVERATDATGPFAGRSEELFPEPYMQWRDTSVEPNRVYWYRLRFESVEGELSHLGPLRIQTIGPGGGVDLLSAVDPGAGQPVQIRYRLGQAAEVRLEIFDTRGRAVRLLESGSYAPGDYVRTWDRADTQGRPAARGVYFVQLGAGDSRYSRRLILLSR